MPQEKNAVPYGDAESLAINGLSFIAEDPDTLGRFLAETGLGPETLRSAAADPSFLCAVLEFFMADEERLLVFVERTRIRPTLIAAARLTLSKSINDTEF